MFDETERKVNHCAQGFECPFDGQRAGKLAEDRMMRRWLLNYALMSFGTVAVMMGVIWAVGGFTDMGLSRDGVIALTIACAMTVFLSFGLMALVFYSGRSGHDETVRDGHDLWEDHRKAKHRHPEAEGDWR